MLNFALLGAGRIGRAHARALNASRDAALTAISDPIAEAANRVADETGARIAGVEDILADQTIDAVIIATPTDMHADQVEAFARAGKAIFCEKPLDLDIARVRACLDVVAATHARLMLGFNRRFDPHFQMLHRRIRDGAIGAVELVQITCRDPAAPSMDYIRRSGGLFRDMMIHDFDMARFLVGEEFVEVFATGSAIIYPEIGEIGDVDTAAVTLKTATGKLVIISNSRRATYGYDQRVEVHGSAGLALAENPHATTVTVANGSGYLSDPLPDFFMQRY
ncbi:MAG: inositol 2-dehydrogenase, partial [Pseudomonadota bacterium]